ncbi:MAG: hypothetical protein ACKVOE_07070 [Rickettsiales bacterium]
MNKILQHIGIHKQNYWLVTILAWGLCFATQAQTPSFSPSSLPPLPPVALATTPSVPLSPDPVKPVSSPEPLSSQLPNPDAGAPKAFPPLEPSGQTSAAAKDAPPTPPPVSPLADLPPPLPESSAQGATNTALPNAGTILSDSPPPPPPGFDLPTPPIERASPIISPPPPLGLATSLPEVTVTAEKPKQKTWKTVLAPTEIPTRTNFNYRRVVLPGTIYREAYSPENRHLPVAVNREQYVALLFQRVAANDVEATRALLNTGISPSQPDASGQTPLSIARRYNAPDTARLLIARGAQG